MILFALLAAAAPPVSASDDAQFAQCARLVKEDAVRGAVAANDWRMKGGGISARHCLGLAYAAQERWAPAATTFDQAADEAEGARDGRLADFRIQAGNAWLAGGEAARARAAFDRALATGLLADELRGEVLLDRARAGVALGDIAGARVDLDRALALVPADPLVWHLSSALALRQNDVVLARTHADKAVSLAPDAAEVLLNAGNAAGRAGDLPAARALFERAVRAAPGSEAGKAAAAALAANADAPAPAGVPPAASPSSDRE